jgi:hypothetical protein
MLRYATWQVLQVYGCEAAPAAWTLAIVEIGDIVFVVESMGIEKIAWMLG